MNRALSASAASDAFGDVGRNGNGSAPHLQRESVGLFPGKGCCEGINGQDEIVGFTPDGKIAKAVCGLAVDRHSAGKAFTGVLRVTPV